MKRSEQGLAIVRQLLSLLAAGIVLALGLMFSVVLFAIIALVGVIFLAWFWWRTRALRRAMREGSVRGVPGDGEIIEGEAVVVTDHMPAQERLLQDDISDGRSLP